MFQQIIRVVGWRYPVMSQWVVHVLAHFITTLIIPDAVVLGVHVIQKLRNMNQQNALL